MADHESIVRSFYNDVLNGRNLALAAELLTSNHVYHDPHVESAPGPAGMIEAVRPYQVGLNGHWEVHDVLVADDYVTVRWTGSGIHDQEVMGIPPSGAKVEVEAISIHRMENGKIAENWTVWDTLTMLQQVGVVPTG